MREARNWENTEDRGPRTVREGAGQRRARRWLARGLLAVVVFFAAAVLVYRSSPTLLTVDSGECRAGAIVVLGGEPYGRPLRAAELFRSGAAPLIIASGDGDCEEVVRALKVDGVPESAILREDKSGSTKQNAEFSVALLRRAHLTNAIVVTSWFHSRRALNTFRKTAPEIRFYSRPSYWGLDRSMWSEHDLGRRIRVEYPKLLAYWLLYGVSPF